MAFAQPVQTVLSDGTAAPIATEATLAALAGARADGGYVKAIAHIDINGWKTITPYRLMLLTAYSVTASNTATLTIFESSDGGTTYSQVIRGDTLAKARAMAIAVGTAKIGSGSYTDCFTIMLRGDTTHIYVQETSPGTDDFTYDIAAL